MYYIIILLIIAFDQITKYFVLQYVKPQITIPIIEDIFHLTFAENTGAAFSILSNRVPLLSVLTSLFIIILILYLHKVISNGNHSKLFPIKLSFKYYFVTSIKIILEHKKEILEVSFSLTSRTNILINPLSSMYRHYMQD